MMPAAELLALSAQCAPSVAPQTLLAVARAESGLNPWAIGVNGGPPTVVRAATKSEAVAKAGALIAQGRNLDLGLGQINSHNLAWLGLTVEDAFDPCKNLAAAASVLVDGYQRADADRFGEQPALRTALSYYNTGAPTRGLANGYVARVVKAAQERAAESAVAEDAFLPSPPSASPAPAPTWDVFGRASVTASFVLTPTLSENRP